MVKEAILKKSEKAIKLKMQNYSKLRDKDYGSENLDVKPYIVQMKLREARTLFRIRSSMIHAKMNMKSNKQYADALWKCDDCMSMDSLPV